MNVTGEVPATFESVTTLLAGIAPAAATAADASDVHAHDTPGAPVAPDGPLPEILISTDADQASPVAEASNVGGPMSWLDISIAVLVAARRPMRAREIVEHANKLGCVPLSRTKTPTQSINRDLHAALRRGEQRVFAGPMPGQFVAAGVPVARLGADAEQTRRGSSAAKPATTARVPRISIGPLAGLVEARGGLRACGVRHNAGESDDQRRLVERLHRGYLRSRSRGWTSIYDADELSVRALGLHPSQVWGEEWWDAIEVPAATSKQQARQRPSRRHLQRAS